MAELMILFESVDGQTKKIAEHAAGLVRKRGHSARVVRVSDVVPDDLNRANAVLLLAPIRDRAFPDSVLAFVRESRSVLAARPSAFFFVSMGAAAKLAMARKGVQKIADAFLASTSWRPDVVASLQGALAYPAYTPWLRFMMRLGARVMRLPTDTSRVHELTDWSAVARACSELLNIVERRARSPVAAVEARR